MQIFVTWSQRVNDLFYHDVGEMLDLSQSEVPNFRQVTIQGYATHDSVSLETRS